MQRLSRDIADGIQAYRPEITKTLFNLLYLRLVVSAGIIAWGIWISYSYNKAKDPAEQDKIKYTNLIWAGGGQTGVFMTLFYIWLVTFLAVSAYPILLKLTVR